MTAEFTAVGSTDEPLAYDASPPALADASSSDEPGTVTSYPPPQDFALADPPSISGRTAKTQVLETFVDFLKAHRGQWAFYPFPLSPNSARPTASRITHGRSLAFTPPTDFEATTRRTMVYVRYVGPPVEPRSDPEANPDTREQP